MDNTRLFLFAALAFVAMLMWQQWQLDYGPQPEISSEVKDTSVPEQAADDDLSNIVDLPDQADGLPVDTNSQLETTVATVPGRLVNVETDVVIAVIDSKGGVIRSLKLKKYPVSLDQPELGLELIHNDPESIHVIQSGLQSGLRNRSKTAPTHHSVYQTAKSKYVLQDGEDRLIVPFLWEQDPAASPAQPAWAPSSRRPQRPPSSAPGPAASPARPSWEPSSKRPQRPPSSASAPGPTAAPARPSWEPSSKHPHRAGSRQFYGCYRIGSCQNDR